MLCPLARGQSPACSGLKCGAFHAAAPVGASVLCLRSVLHRAVDERPLQGGFRPVAAGTNCLYELNLEQSCKGIFIDCVCIDCYTKVVFQVKQVLHTKTPDLFYMLCEGNHHTLQL